MTIDFNGRVAIVTGAGGGLGRQHALALAKRSFNADTAHIAGISALGLQAVSLFYGTEESKEGVRAFQEKRPAVFVGR